MATDKDIVKDAQDAFKAAEEAEKDNREEALDDLKFARLGEQWPDDVKKGREREGRPCLTINRMPAFIRQVVNDARQNKPSIKVHPVDDNADVKTGEILNGLIRNIEVVSNADIAYDTGIDHSVTMGFGYWRVTTDYAHDDSFDLDIHINRVLNPFTVYGDPDAQEGDGSDWTRALVTERLKRDEYKRKYKDAPNVDWTLTSTGDDDEWESKDEVRIAEYWERAEVERKIVLLSDGAVWDEKDYLARKEIFDMAGLQVVNSRKSKSWKVKQHWIGGKELLETVEWPGIYIPIIPVYGDEVNVEGKRYYQSLIRFAKDPQRMFNYWRTVSTELVALAPKTPFIGKEGAFDVDAQKWATANVKSHAFIQFAGDQPPQRQPFAGPPAGALQEAMNATDDMKSVMGLYDASLGARSNETSGRAIMARQREGDTSTFHFIDNMNRAIRHTGRILVDLIPKVYDKPRVLRIMGEDGKSQNVQVNQPTQDQTGAQLIYDLTNGKYDVTVSTGPNYTTKREEFVNSMMAFTQSNPNVFPLVGDMVAKNMDWPEAEKVAARFQAMLPPPIQALEKGEAPIPPQVQQQMQQMQQVMQQMQQGIQQGAQQVQQLQQENQTLKAGLQVKQQEVKVKEMEAQTKQFEAVTNRMEALENRMNMQLERMTQMSPQQPMMMQDGMR